MFPAFEGLHNNIKFVIIGRKLFKGNDRQGEREQSIVTVSCDSFYCFSKTVISLLCSLNMLLFINGVVDISVVDIRYQYQTH